MIAGWRGPSGRVDSARLALSALLVTLARPTAAGESSDYSAALARVETAATAYREHAPDQFTPKKRIERMPTQHPAPSFKFRIPNKRRVGFGNQGWWGTRPDGARIRPPTGFPVSRSDSD